MQNNYKYIVKLTAIVLLFANSLYAQYPGGVSTGTTRGYKVDYYNGTFSSVSQFGAGSTNSTPGLTGYSNKITGTEYNQIDADYYGMEYTGILEITTAGNYTFSLTGDDAVSLYIDGVIKVSATYAAGSTVIVNLTAGDHTIKVKHYELGGANSAALQFTATPAGSGITSPTDVDGRFVRNDNSKLTAWYKASDLNVTANYGGAGIDKVNTWLNKAPDNIGSGNMTYNGTGTSETSPASLVNFNPGVRFNGDDLFWANQNQKNLSYRGATKSMFLISDYASNPSQSNVWMFYHLGANTTNGWFGIWKQDGSNTQATVYGSGTASSSVYTSNEPKLLGAFVDQVTGGSAPSGTNPISISQNGSAPTTSSLFSNVVASDTFGLVFGNSASYPNNAIYTEAIYYPFKLSSTQERQVNTYLAIKYGISLPNDYLNTSGTIVFNRTANGLYTNRIFGIGREMASEGLNQKQSQSQMASASGYDFLVVSKGTIQTTNAANSSILADGDYLIMGDDSAALGSQSTEIPSSLSSAGCTVSRLTREWKVQVTGNPGAVTIQAGSAGSFLFPGSASGLVLMVDTDNDGNFSTGTVANYPVTSVTSQGVATFNNVNLVNGNVFTFGWILVSPGGVNKPSTGTLIGGSTYVNGLAYKLYSTNGTAGSIATGFGAYGATLLGSGYYHNATTFHNFATQKITTNYGVELTGKLNITASSATYQFRANATDDEFTLIIDGTTIIDQSTTGTVTSGNINLAVGYHDIIIRGRNLSGPQNFDLQWNSGAGGAFSAIPDANFFVSPTGPSAWYKADDNNFSALADGASLVGQTWMDQSGNNNNTPQTAGAPTFYKTNTAYMSNYNPSVLILGGGWFNFGTANYLNGFAYGMQGKTITGIGSATNEATMRLLSGYGYNALNDMFGIGKAGSGGNLLLYGYNNTLSGSPAAFGATATTQLMGGIYKNNNITATNNATLYFNNAANGTGTMPWYTRLSNTNGELFIGTAPSFGSNVWNGTINEVIYYPWDLSAAERTRVNTYLAIKYSTPLGNGSGTSTSDYLASDGVTNPWLGNATYKYGMFGIGRDDCSGLLQKQSKLGDGTDNVAFGLTAIAANNASNAGVFTTNKQFVLIGNDGGALSGITANIPANYTALSCNSYRYARNWKVKNTGAVSTMLQMIIGDSSNLIPSNWGNVRLAINSAGDATFSSGVTTLIAPTTLNGGVATFNNVALPDGVVFTLCYTLAFPGGVNKPTGISITTVSGTTTNNVNGLTYKLYSTNGTTGSIATGFGAYSPTLLGTGYYNNATSFHAFPTQKISDNYGVELTGILNVSGSATYQFRANATDDEFALIIDGITLINQAAPGTITTGNVNLTAGYHDIIIRGREISGSQNFDLQWNNGAGAVFSAIPDANFYTAPTGPSAWYEADDNELSLQADGTNMSGVTWNDLSGNGNDISGNGNPIYYSTTSNITGYAGIQNFNPSIYFTSDFFGNTGNYINGFAYGKQGKTVFGVGSNNNAGGETIYTAFGQDAANSNFGITKISTGKLQLFGSSNTLTEAGTFYGTSTVSTDIISGSYSNGNIAGAANNTYLFANGRQKALASLPAWNTTFNDNLQLAVGAGPDYSNSFWYVKNLNEIIYYPWELTALEKQKVNSYLAIKWGTTLDQTTPTDYLASDGSIIWNSSTNASFKYDITGIGRDDCGNLNQKQSTSTDSTDIVGMGIGGIASNNISNTNTFANDKSFLTFSNNNGSVTFTGSYSDIPASLASCYTHFQRIWQVQTVNNPGAVTVSMGKKGLVIVNASLYRPVLLVSNTTDFTNATTYNYTTYSQGTVYFNNVAFTNGQYFTMAYIPAGPGGVTAGLTTWFNSDYDVYTDVAQTTPATNAGDVVRSINNLKAYATFADVEEVNSAYNPTYQPGKFNYNAGILFDGVDDVLASASNINTTDYRTTTQMTSMLSAAVVGTGSNQNVFWYHDGPVGASYRKTALERPQAFWSDDNTNHLYRVPTLTLPEIYTFANTVGGTWRLYSNLTTVGSGTTGNGGTNNVNGRFRIGSNLLDGTGSPANFYLGEFTIFGTDLGAVTTPEMRRIHSYAATKYGFTLDITAMGGAYYASDGTTQTFNYATHWNRITGIGRDDCSAFEQKQSRSTETGMMVKISNDAANGLAATNQANTATFAVNKSFEVFGDDNKAVIWTGIDKIYDATFGDLVRLVRTWKVKETGTVGSVYLEVTGNGGTGTKLPAGATTSSPVYLIVSNSADFKNPIAIKEMIPDTLPNATKWSVSYDFADGNYYTFATTIMCLAPGGNAEGLTSWYKFNNKPTGAVTNITDDSLSGYTLSYAPSSTSVNVTSGTATLFNYNRYLPLTGTTYFEKLALNETSVYAVNAGTTFAVGNTTTKDIMGFGRVTSPFRRTGLGGNTAYFNDATNTYPSSSNTPNILAANTSPGGTSATKNHVSWNNGIAGASATLTAANLAAASDYSLRLGSITPNAAGVFNTGLAEGITYNRSLSTTETQVVNTYLALKYGQTLAHNYFTPNYDGTNASTTTLYDVSTYGNRVFGVGNDKAGCFYQNQSTSALSGSMLKISADGILSSENSQDTTVWTNNQTYVAIGDDNGDVNTNGWITSSTSPVVHQPVIYTYTNGCAKRISRQWKITTTGTNPAVLITVPGSGSTTSTTKLPVIPVNASNPNSLYMVINDNPDFAINANQSEILMTLNPATGDYETTQTFAAGVTKYITFIYRPKVCRNCIITNVVTSTTRKN